MNTTTYILSAPAKQEAIVFIFHNFKAGKQVFPSLGSAPIRLKKCYPELRKNTSSLTTQLTTHMRVILPSMMLILIYRGQNYSHMIGYEEGIFS
jgi:hypothetical protein